MNFLPFLPGILKTLGKVLGVKVFDDAANVLTNTQIPPEKQAELQEAMLAHEAQMEQIRSDELKTIVSQALAEAQSADAYVRRARPTGLYIFYLTSGAIAIGMLLGVKIDPTAVLTILGPLAGVGGTYVYQRTQEKKAGAA